ncbi:hypothetical protein [Spirosoma rhododendri]|uniref:Uncharacterized protein n=1 Tax=Spirosoma rhododendri TaxID=2728024 RepID=A0A7L5DVJ4_9BACT|nr:hypothetical protein [Spirosoma rhododendri]QJD79570.1 hypothetical protein HH216_14965 [Spirosoma rhododendri]
MMLTHYHFQLYDSFTGTAADLRVHQLHIQPRLRSLGISLDSTVSFHVEIDGTIFTEEEIDSKDTKLNQYQFHVTYTGTEEYPLNVIRIHEAVDALGRQFGMRWKQYHVWTAE